MSKGAAVLLLSLCSCGALSRGHGDGFDLYRQHVVGSMNTTVASLAASATSMGLRYDASTLRPRIEALFVELAAPETDPWPELARAVRRLWGDLPPLRLGMSPQAWTRANLDRYVLAWVFELAGQVTLMELKNDLATVLESTARNREERPAVIARWEDVDAGVEDSLEIDETAAFHAWSASREPAPRRDDDAVILAHRGSAYLHAENSMAAFRHALGLGADGFECDLRLAGDGTVVVAHDRDLKRLTGWDVDLRELTRAQVTALRLRDPLDPDRLGTERPVLLEQLLEEFAGHTILWLELKPGEGPELAERVGDLLEGLDDREGIIVSSFAVRQVERLRNRFPDLKVALEMPRLEPLTLDDLEQPPEPGAHGTIISSRLASQLAPRVLELLLARGFETSEFTPNRFDALRSALRNGVTYIQTDRPDRALYLRESGAAGE